MIWQERYNRAFDLAIQGNHTFIINDLRSMSEDELLGVIALMLKLQGV